MAVEEENYSINYCNNEDSSDGLPEMYFKRSSNDESRASHSINPWGELSSFHLTCKPNGADFSDNTLELLCCNNKTDVEMTALHNLDATNKYQSETNSLMRSDCIKKLIFDASSSCDQNSLSEHFEKIQNSEHLVYSQCSMDCQSPSYNVHFKEQIENPENSFHFNLLNILISKENGSFATSTPIPLKKKLIL